MVGLFGGIHISVYIFFTDVTNTFDNNKVSPIGGQIKRTHQVPCVQCIGKGLKCLDFFKKCFVDGCEVLLRNVKENDQNRTVVLLISIK